MPSGIFSSDRDRYQQGIAVPKLLTASQIEQFRENGCIHPIRAISEADALELRRKLEAFERGSGGPPPPDLPHHSPPLFPPLPAPVPQTPNCAPLPHPP